MWFVEVFWWVVQCDLSDWIVYWMFGDEGMDVGDVVVVVGQVDCVDVFVIVDEGGNIWYFFDVWYVLCCLIVYYYLVVVLGGEVVGFVVQCGDFECGFGWYCCLCGCCEYCGGE